MLVSNKVSGGGSNQNLMLFISRNAISGAPSISGTNQFLNPLIMIGITMKKIVTKAWAVTIWSSPIKDPGCPSSFRISIRREVPTILYHAPNTKSNVP